MYIENKLLLVNWPILSLFEAECLTFTTKLTKQSRSCGNTNSVTPDLVTSVQDDTVLVTGLLCKVSVKQHYHKLSFTNLMSLI